MFFFYLFLSTKKISFRTYLCFIFLQPCEQRKPETIRINILREEKKIKQKHDITFFYMFKRLFMQIYFYTFIMMLFFKMYFIVISKKKKNKLHYNFIGNY